MNRFSDYFKTFLDINNFTLSYIAKRTGYSVASISHYISCFRNPSYKFLSSFFKEFKISKGEQLEIIKMIELDKMPDDMHKLKKGVSSDNASSTLINKINSLSPSEKKQVKFFIDTLLKNR